MSESVHYSLQSPRRLVEEAGAMHAHGVDITENIWLFVLKATLRGLLIRDIQTGGASVTVVYVDTRPYLLACALAIASFYVLRVIFDTGV